MTEINVDIERARVLVARIMPRSSVDPTVVQTMTSLAKTIEELSQRLQSIKGSGGDPELLRLMQELMRRSSAGVTTLQRLSTATDNYLQNLEKAKQG